MQQGRLVAVLLVLWQVASCPAAQVVTQPFQGITLIHRTETTPRPLDIHVALIDTLAPGIEFHVTPESPHAADTVIGRTTRQFVTQTGAQLGINGGFYSSAGTINGQPHRSLSSFAVSEGNVYSAFDSSEPAIHIGQNNAAHAIVAAAQNPVGKRLANPAVPLWNAIGGWAYLVNNGSFPTYWDNPNDWRYTMANALHPRTAMGLSADRRYVALFVVDGRQPHSGGMSFPEMASMLRDDYGMHWAINLDGGGSTTMVIADSTPRVLNQPSDGVERVVGNNWAVSAWPAPPPIPGNALTARYRQQAGVYTHVGAQIQSNLPGQNLGDAGDFQVGYDVTQGRARNVFSFDLSGIPSNAVVHSVSLMLQAFQVNGTTGFRYVDLELFRLEAEVAEGQVTWNESQEGSPWTTAGGDFSQPAISTLFAQQTAGLKMFVSTVDFVAAAQEAVAGGQPLSLLLAAPDAEQWGETNGANLNLRFRSDDATTGQRPQLTVHYTLPLAGDINGDGVVDAADYIAMRKLGTIFSPSHYDQWRANYGQGAGSAHSNDAAAAVPEPNVLVWTLGVLLVLRGRRAATKCLCGLAHSAQPLRDGRAVCTDNAQPPNQG